MQMATPRLRRFWSRARLPHGKDAECLGAAHWKNPLSHNFANDRRLAVAAAAVIAYAQGDVKETAAHCDEAAAAALGSQGSRGPNP